MAPFNHNSFCYIYVVLDIKWYQIVEITNHIYHQTILINYSSFRKNYTLITIRFPLKLRHAQFKPNEDPKHLLSSRKS